MSTFGIGCVCGQAFYHSIFIYAKKMGNDWWVMQIMTVWNDYTMH